MAAVQLPSACGPHEHGSFRRNETPLLDVEAIRVVTGLRNAGMEDWRKPHKWLLIEAFGELLPPEIISRKNRALRRLFRTGSPKSRQPTASPL